MVKVTMAWVCVVPKRRWGNRCAILMDEYSPMRWDGASAVSGRRGKWWGGGDRDTLLLCQMVRSDQTTSRSLCWPRNDSQVTCVPDLLVSRSSLQGPETGQLRVQLLVHGRCCSPGIPQPHLQAWPLPQEGQEDSEPGDPSFLSFPLPSEDSAIAFPRK